MYVVAAFATIRIAHRHSPQSAPKTLMLMRVAEGFRIAVRNPQVGGILALTVLYDLFGWPFISMIPVIGQTTSVSDPRELAFSQVRKEPARSLPPC